MNTCIKRLRNWFAAHPSAGQWGWFVLLWCAGLAAVLAVAYPIKWLMRGL